MHLPTTIIVAFVGFASTGALAAPLAVTAPENSHLHTSDNLSSSPTLQVRAVQAITAGHSELYVSQYHSFY